jgi:hypothetical protein
MLSHRNAPLHNLTDSAQSHLAITAVAFAAMTIGALTGWSRLCEAEKERARAHARTLRHAV